MFRGAGLHLKPVIRPAKGGNVCAGVYTFVESEAIPSALAAQNPAYVVARPKKRA